MVVAAKYRWNAGEPRHNRTNRKNDKRYQHRIRRLVNVMNLLVGVPGCSVESQNQQAEHVERRETCRKNTDKPKHSAVIGVIPRAPQNRILAEEAGQRGKTGDGQCSGEKCFVRPGHQASEAAHLSYILDTSHSMNDTTGGKKKERLEERMSHQVEDAGGIGSGAAREEHVSKLADCGVCENFLDIGLD